MSNECQSKLSRTSGTTKLAFLWGVLNAFAEQKIKALGTILLPEVMERVRRSCPQCSGTGERVGYGDNLIECVWCAGTGTEGGFPVTAVEVRQQMFSQGRCDVTETLRFEPENCKCPTYPGNLGPCAKHELGANGRCVYCDHNLDCKPKVEKA